MNRQCVNSNDKAKKRKKKFYSCCVGPERRRTENVLSDPSTEPTQKHREDDHSCHIILLDPLNQRKIQAPLPHLLNVPQKPKDRPGSRIRASGIQRLLRDLRSKNGS